MLRSESRVCVVTPASLLLAPKGCLCFEVPLISGMRYGGRHEGLRRDGTDRHML